MQISKLTLPLYIILSLIFSLYTFQSHFADDAYIHARIVENFINYGNFSFIKDIVFKASSSTGYALLLAFLGKFIDVVLAIRIVNFIALLGIFAILFILQQRYKSILEKLSLYIPLPALLVSSYAGMETCIAILFMYLSFYQILGNNYKYSLLFGSVCVLFRLEFFLYVVLLVLYQIHEKHFKVRYLIYLLPVYLYVGIDLLLYGTIIPHAALAKPTGYNFPLLESIKRALYIFDYGILSVAIFALVAYYVIKADVIPLLTRKAVKLELLFYLFFAGVVCSWMLGRSLIFRWYIPIVFAPLSIALCLSQKNREGGATIRLASIVLTCISLVHLCGICAGFKSYESAKDTDRVSYYLDIAGELYKAFPQASLVTSEIGGIGYAFKGKVYDGFGLGDPEAVQFHPMKVPTQRKKYSDGAIPVDYIKFRDPDFIVSMPNFSTEFRESALFDSYNNYFCPFRKNFRLWTDTGIMVHSKMKLDVCLLQRMGCADYNPDKDKIGVDDD